ncbi:TonB-dependent receptor plug domain-containing protein [Janthinobacterium fluminis]|uniref:TonB-dependent receptor n=1 Tax=Janthinobacterium fluminis TaxID=2987524 RepID=A0ABT5K4K6_9BURK|nr:TonB-dependent receptor [Janthinobacterium fluminis]MDC8759923.1 TonB-dependent receptor [Janthinobacterium fluminis]
MHRSAQHFPAWRPALAGAALGLSALSAAAMDADNFAGMSLEELGNVKITSVSKRAERLADAPAAVFVIDAADIRRSGAASLREALRLAPNLQVNQVSASGYTVSARGFAGSDGNKLLVLIDGRSVYTPLFAGVFWDAQDLALDDIERIEVISGPGGTLWGTNAVNGVINVITRPAQATQGGLLSAGAGTRLRDASVRYGGSFGGDGAYRVYAKAFDERRTENASGAPVDDAWHKAQLGFRADWGRGADRFNVQGDVYRGLEGQPKPGSIALNGLKLDLGRIEIAGANLMAHWSRALDGGATLSAQAYYDRSERTVPPTFAEKLDIVDVQAQYQFAPLGRHQLVLGGQYRHAQDHLTNSVYFAFLPADDRQSWSSLFVQDEVRLTPALRLTLGLRLERNGYTGMERLPNARLAWKLAPDTLLWGAVSRTVRAPSRLDRETFVPGKPPFLLNGGANFESELADVFELGYRSQVSSRLSFSVNTYRALYDQLHTQELVPNRRPIQVYFGNGMKGATSGIELWGSFQAAADWRLSAAYTALKETLALKPGSIDTAASVKKVGRDPAHTWSLRSSWQMSRHTELDVALRRVAALTVPDVPAYTALDMHFGWTPRPDLELSISGQNLFGPGHGEFTDIANRSQLGRTFFVKLNSRF